MQSKILSKRASIVIPILRIVSFFVITLFLTLGLVGRDSHARSALPISIQASPNLVASQPIVSIVAIAQTSLALPIRLKIPRINVDAAIEPVGLTAGAKMAVPKDPLGVGWYNLGRLPGEIGSAVIAGHNGVWENGSETVFDNLNKLRPGDKLSVLDDKEEATTFVVRTSKSYDPKAGTSEIFSSNDGKSHLNLVTCEGVWNAVSKSYPGRLVVFADKE